MKALFLIEGRVQMVGYRHFIRTHAKKIGLKGGVRNLADGRVEAFFEGSDTQISAMYQVCLKGPLFSRVDRIKLDELANLPDGDGFYLF